LTLLTLAFVVLTMTQDLVRSDLNNSAFYFSESLIFSSFWWLFAPILFAQYVVIKHKNKKPSTFRLAVIIAPILIHLFAFPFLVWVLSAAFYYHTYSYQQVLAYTISEHMYLLVLLYTIPVVTFLFISEKAKLAETVPAKQKESNLNQYITSIVVSDSNKKHHIAVSDILYFSANPPYINLHLEDKKHLHNDTLKSISGKLNPEHFVRVHKSAIINIKMVISCTTRLNGDYDIMMKNNVQLRVSRNYARDFKNLFNNSTHFTTK